LPAAALGRAIVSTRMNELRRLAAAEADASPIANDETGRLSAQYHFTPTAPAASGMAQWIGR
jgi:hypothetical protein